MKKSNEKQAPAPVQQVRKSVVITPEKQDEFVEFCSKNIPDFWVRQIVTFLNSCPVIELVGKEGYNNVPPAPTK